ncbi:amidohydrolase family protein [Nocardia sp. NPDC004750]
MGSTEAFGKSGATTSRAFSAAVDVHHHIVPDFYSAALKGSGYAHAIQGVDYPSWKPQSSLEMMDRQGVETAIVSLTVPGVSLDPDLAPRLAHQINDFIADLGRTHEGRFGGWAAIPLPDTDAAIAEVSYALDKLGLDGVGLFTNYGGTYLGDDAFHPLLEDLNRRRAVAFIHPTVPPAKDQPNFGLPVSLCEFPFDTTRALAQLLYNGTFERYPDIRFIFAHGGGTVPYLAERLTFGTQIDASLADRQPADLVGLLQRQYYEVAMSASPFAFPALQRMANPERILYGSDFPFMPATACAVNAAHLATSDALNDRDFQRIARLNAETLLPRLVSGF